MHEASDAPQVRYVAIGDSFSEGVGDELPDGSPRGWTDLVAQGWAAGLDAPIAYANVAIRGKLIEPIVREQLDAALALGPTHLSFNGGGNDMLRPRADLERILGQVGEVVERCAEQGVELLLLSGGNPCARLPLGRRIQARGDLLAEAIGARFEGRPGVTVVQNWFDATLATEPFWSADRLHMNTRGHHRVAARLLDRLGMSPPEPWWNLERSDAASGVGGDSDPERDLRGLAYYRAHVGPWVKRRLTGTSSGDGRLPKHAEWIDVLPAGALAR